MATFRSKGERLAIGSRVTVRGTPFTGTVEDSLWRPDWGTMAFVVSFDDVGPSQPPGGEFTRRRLEMAAVGRDGAV